MRSRKLTERRRQAEIIRCRLLVFMAERGLSLSDVARDTGYSYDSIRTFTEIRRCWLSWPVTCTLLKVYPDLGQLPR